MSEPSVATVEAERRAGAVLSGRAETNSCDGSFAVALDDDEHRLRIDVDRSSGSTDVEWVEVSDVLDASP